MPPAGPLFYMVLSVVLAIGCTFNVNALIKIHLSDPPRWMYLLGASASLTVGLLAMVVSVVKIMHATVG